jgi:superfamily II DNA or RNA helicase
MAGIVDYDYDFFDEYQMEVLDELPTIEQLIRLDDEVANEVLLPRYAGPVDPVEWTDLERYYSRLFAGFITERIEGIVDTTPIEENEEKFHTFRRNIASLNGKLPGQRTARTDIISKPAETVLLKRIRQLGFDPSALDVSHVGGGSGIYLLELFVTAAQQEAVSDTELLSALLEEATSLGDLSEEAAMEKLHRAVLMVSLWDNQEEGLDRWLSNDRLGILEMATATGKTVAGIAAIAECCGVLPDDSDHEPWTDDANIMVVAHSNAILKQWEREIQEKLGLPMPSGETGEKADTLSFSGGEIEFYTAQSLLPRYDRDLVDTYDLVIYDEVHHYANEEGYGAAIDRPNYRAAMGLSATIGDEGDLKRGQLTELLADVVYTYGVEDARRDGIIPEFDWTVHPTPLDPYEREEWEETTESISDQFKHIRRSSETKRLLRQLSVPFTELEDLGDFIRAHEAASMVFDEDEIPDEWANLQATIHSRTWIRHRSQPKIENAIDLAKDYLSDPDQPIKVVIFAMDIATADEIADQLTEVTDNVYRAHSQLEGSSKKNNERVQRNIDAFAQCDNGVLVSPKMLDEGIDVPDAEVGINVAGTKTKLQLVQRMGRVLRRHGDQRPHFHHFIAIPDENYIEGIDSKEYVQELNWVRELGETIGVQPVIEEAGVDSSLLARAEQRGNELWAQDLLNDLEVETVQGNVHLDELLEALTVEAAEILLDELWLEGDEVAQDDWEDAMEELRNTEALAVEGLQRVWWLFPLYRERPGDLDELLTAALGAMLEEEDIQRSSRGSTEESSDRGRENQETDETSDYGETEESQQEATTNQDRGRPDKEDVHSTAGRSIDENPSEGESTNTEAPRQSSDERTTEERVGADSGINNSPLASLDEHEITTGVDTEFDEDLLTGVGKAGFLSKGYLHERPLEAYLGDGEDPKFVLASNQQPPEHSDRSIPDLDGYQTITAVTPTRIVCVVGNEPENEVFEVDYDEVTGVEVIQSGHLLWKRSVLRVETDDYCLDVPNGTATHLQTVVNYVRSAVYKEKLSSAQRRLETISEVRANKSDGEVAAMLQSVRRKLQYALHWGNTHGFDTSLAKSAIEFVDDRIGRIDTRPIDRNEATEVAEDEGDETDSTPSREKLVSELQSLKETLGNVPKAPEMDERGAYLTHDYYQEFGDWDTALAAAGIDKKRGLIEELEHLAIELGEVPSSGQIDEHGRYSSGMYAAEFGSIRAARDAADFSSKLATGSESVQADANASDDGDGEASDKPTREDLIAEIRRLDQRERLVPYAADMDSDGAYKTYDCLQEFGSWDEALAAAGIDKEERLIEELQRLRDTLGRKPKTSDMNAHGAVSAGMYSSFFGSWTEAISRISDEPSPENQIDQGSSEASPLNGDSSHVLTWEDIPDNGRLPGPIAIRVNKSLRTLSDRVAGRYRVEDLNGKEFDLKDWSKHSIDINWETGCWYVVLEARGTVWESDGETKRMLDSTKDLQCVFSGAGRPTADDISE